MKIIVAPDSFKGSLSAQGVCEAVKAGILTVCNDAEVISVPIADGGEGMLEVILQSIDADVYTLEVCGPYGKKTTAKYAITKDGTAIIEMAQAAGLTLASDEEKNPQISTTKGVGEMIKDALDKGAKKMVIGLGGSATNDGGVGAAAELGVIFLDESGSSLQATGINMAKLKQIDFTQIDKRLENVEILMACDVQNPLCGEIGATYIYGPQKGVKPDNLPVLDAALKNLADVVYKCTGNDYESHKGAGAAGGLGYGILAFMGGKFSSGIETVLDICDFDEKLSGAQLVITGEGKIDGQSAFGKVLYGIGHRAMAKNVPVIALGGAVDSEADELIKHGISAMFAIETGPVSLDTAMEKAPIYIEETAKNIMRVFCINR